MTLKEKYKRFRGGWNCDICRFRNQCVYGMVSAAYFSIPMGLPCKDDDLGYWVDEKALDESLKMKEDFDIYMLRTLHNETKKETEK